MSSATPRVSKMRLSNDGTPRPSRGSGNEKDKSKKHGRTRSYISLGMPPTPTTAFSHVEVRGTIVDGHGHVPHSHSSSAAVVKAFS